MCVTLCVCDFVCVFVCECVFATGLCLCISLFVSVIRFMY